MSHAEFNVWTDGSYRHGNGKDGGSAGAAWFIKSKHMITEGSEPFFIGDRLHQVHGPDIAEMKAVARALRQIPPGSTVHLHVDSEAVKQWLESPKAAFSKASITPLHESYRDIFASIAGMKTFKVAKVSRDNPNLAKVNMLARAASGQARSPKRRPA